MLMPSLFKYFAFVGAALFAVLSLANFLLDPSTGATQVAATAAKRAIVVQHDPRASKVERWRDEQVALKAAEQTQLAPQTQVSQSAALTAKSTVVPAAKPTPAPAPAAQVAASAAQVAAPAPQPVAQPQSQPAVPVAAAVIAAPEPAPPQPVAAVATDTSSIMGVAETTDDRAAKAAERKAKIAKAKARKDKLARERAIAAQTDPALNGRYPRTAANTQDQYYYGQRGGQQQPFTTRYSSAFAPQPSFGPFGWGGRGW